MIKLEEFILNGVHGFVSGMFFQALKNDYPKEFLKIYEEVAPKKYKKYIETEKRKEKKELEQEKKRKKQEKKQRELLRKQWIKAGGK